MECLRARTCVCWSHEDGTLHGWGPLAKQAVKRGKHSTLQQLVNPTINIFANKWPISSNRKVNYVQIVGII